VPNSPQLTPCGSILSRVPYSLERFRTCSVDWCWSLWSFGHYVQFLLFLEKCQPWNEFLLFIFGQCRKSDILLNCATSVCKHSRHTSKTVSGRWRWRLPSLEFGAIYVYLIDSPGLFTRDKAPCLSFTWGIQFLREQVGAD